MKPAAAAEMYLQVVANLRRGRAGGTKLEIAFSKTLETTLKERAEERAVFKGRRSASWELPDQKCKIANLWIEHKARQTHTAR